MTHTAAIIDALQALYAPRGRVNPATASTWYWSELERVSGVYDVALGAPDRPRCAYCGRSQAMTPNGGCVSCGAPLPMRGR